MTTILNSYKVRDPSLMLKEIVRIRYNSNDFNLDKVSNQEIINKWKSYNILYKLGFKSNYKNLDLKEQNLFQKFLYWLLSRFYFMFN